MSYCNNENDPILRDDCRSLSKTYKLLLSKTNLTFKESIDGMEVVGDVSDIDTYTELLETAAAQILEIEPTDLTAPEFRTGTLGTKEVVMGVDDPVYIVHIKTNDEYLRAIEQLRYYSGKYIGFIQEDDTIQLYKSDADSSNINMFRLDQVTPLGKSPMQNGTDVPTYLIRLDMRAKQTFGTVTRKLDFDADVLEQLNVIADGDLTMTATTDQNIITDNVGGILIDGVSGSATSGDIEVYHGETKIDTFTYETSGGVLTVEDSSSEGNPVTVRIITGSAILNPKYHGTSITAIVAGAV